MTDEELWRTGIAALAREYGALPPALRERIAELAAQVRENKLAIHDCVTAVNVGAICADCRGECCARGKNHVTVVDLLVCLVEGRELVVPRFDHDLCPYLGENGCQMAPPYRPFACIIFNCDRVEGLMEPSEKERLYGAERRLRALYGEFEKLFGKRFMAGLLIICERDLVRQGATLLGVGNGEAREN
ncbi:hypothetical protein [Geobacter sp. AOG1]|uniref:hypothetical protein n=1 Tax=Geobacter sp. AOG1 TaxID=1566346 RepID=UPI001CC3B62C|nr:hypothetical protein [Geobacter sp. AOG1]GFE57524.1 hypothetical protein AOG1_14040 [Geobacter sp. AOG1]